MGGVGVVGAEHKAVRHRARGSLPAVGHSIEDAVQHIPQEAALGTHPAGGADLLVVKHGPDGGAGAVGLAGGLQKREQRCGGALQIVNARGHEIFVVGADLHGGLPGDKLQIPVEDLLRRDAKLLADKVGQRAAACGTPQRLHVDLGIEHLALVHIPLEVDGQ